MDLKRQLQQEMDKNKKLEKELEQKELDKSEVRCQWDPDRQFMVIQ